MVDRDQDIRRSKCQYYATISWEQLDIDQPSLENVQALILHSLSYLVLGEGRKCWMRLGAAIRMIFALELHHEPFPDEASFVEKESARRCFFTCYMMDRFSVCGSKRPMFITNESLISPAIDGWINFSKWRDNIMFLPGTRSPASRKRAVRQCHFYGFRY